MISNMKNKDCWVPLKWGLLPNIDDEVIITGIDGRVRYEMWYGGLENGKPFFYRWDDEMYNCFTIEAVAWRYPLEPYKEGMSE